MIQPANKNPTEQKGMEQIAKTIFQEKCPETTKKQMLIYKLKQYSVYLKVVTCDEHRQNIFESNYVVFLACINIMLGSAH